MNSIRLLLEYKAFPVWIYDEEGLVIDTCLPLEWQDDTELESIWQQVIDIYDSLFIDTNVEFKFVGFESQDAKDGFIKLVNQARSMLEKKNNGKYVITDDLEPESISVKSNEQA